jgi:hypothetical protein
VRLKSPVASDLALQSRIANRWAICFGFSPFVMRTLLLAGVLAVAGFAIATPISIAPASAQVAVETPFGGVRVGPEPRYYRDYDRPAYRAYGYDRGYGGCRTVTIERDDGSVRRVRRCD